MGAGLRTACPRDTRGPQGPKCSYRDSDWPGLELMAQEAREPTSSTHLWLVTVSPAGASGLVGGGVEKGLPGRGLREAGLE